MMTARTRDILWLHAEPPPWSSSICPFTERCRADAIKTFEGLPEVVAIFRESEHCNVKSQRMARKCAAMLGYIDNEADEVQP
jgi:hypothetical protein